MPEHPEQPKAAQGGEHPPIPADAMIVLPVRQTVLFPGLVLPLTIGRKSSIAAAQEAVRSERMLGVVLQTDPAVEEPTPQQLHSVGTAAQVLRYVTAPDGTHHVIAQGVRRFRVAEYLSGYPFLVARIEEIGVAEVMTPEIEARVRLVRSRAREAMELLPNVPPEVAATLEGLDSPSALADFIAGILDAKPAEKQDVLETIDIKERLDKVLALLVQRIEVLKISKEIGEQTQQSLSSQQREHILREQLRHIQKELGEGDEKSVEIGELREAIEKAGMPKEAEDQAKKELKRLERMPDASPEYGMIRAYLDWLVGLPWSTLDPDTIDIAEARRILDEDHYGLPKIKRRILEYLAVRKLNPDGRSPILCFVGPPGVGKTSLGQSIAKATGRKFVRLSLGGVHDEAEIRGHRRTYIGALPGNIIQSIRKAGTRNPVMMLDEVDKLGAGFHGDPSSALLEVLDPEQNSTFRDNYLGVPFDLSKVMFIATANVLDTIPGPVRDRMEVIELPGYTEDEKVEIARRYLLKRQLSANGLRPEQCEITEDAIRSIIRDYTREAGVRNLERLIGAVCRHVAVRIAEGSVERMRIDATALPAILGPRRFENEVAMRTSVPGVATGLAWTPTGERSGGHLLGEMLKTRTGANMVHIPYRGAGPAALDLAAGRVDFFFVSYSSVLPFLQAGKVRVLAVTSPQRLPALPDAPTMREAGFAGIAIDTWFGLVAPAGTSDAVIDKLNAAFVQAVRDPEVARQMAEQGADPVVDTPEEFAAFIASQTEQVGKIVRAVGVKGE
jgi:ATP-dependent Lon protease